MSSHSDDEVPEEIAYKMEARQKASALSDDAKSDKQRVAIGATPDGNPGTEHQTEQTVHLNIEKKPSEMSKRMTISPISGQQTPGVGAISEIRQAAN